MTTQAHIAEAIDHFKAQAVEFERETDLVEADVVACVGMYKKGWTLEAIESRFNLTDDTILCIRRIVSH